MLELSELSSRVWRPLSETLLGDATRPSPQLTPPTRARDSVLLFAPALSEATDFVSGAARNHLRRAFKSRAVSQQDELNGGESGQDRSYSSEKFP